MRLPKDRLGVEYYTKIYACTKKYSLMFPVGTHSSFFIYLWLRDSFSVPAWHWSVKIFSPHSNRTLLLQRLSNIH